MIEPNQPTNDRITRGPRANCGRGQVVPPLYSFWAPGSGGTYSYLTATQESDAGNATRPRTGPPNVEERNSLFLPFLFLLPPSLSLSALSSLLLFLLLVHDTRDAPRVYLFFSASSSLRLSLALFRDQSSRARQNCISCPGFRLWLLSAVRHTPHRRERRRPPLVPLPSRFRPGCSLPSRYGRRATNRRSGSDV